MCVCADSQILTGTMLILWSKICLELVATMTWAQEYMNLCGVSVLHLMDSEGSEMDKLLRQNPSRSFFVEGYKLSFVA